MAHQTRTAIVHPFGVRASAGWLCLLLTTFGCGGDQPTPSVERLAAQAHALTPNTCQTSPDGTSCDDGNPCTRTDTCMNGVCRGGNPITCPAPDQCRTAGSCEPSTGACSYPNAPDGQSCFDADVCTGGDVCRSGVCGGDAISTGPLCDGAACRTITRLKSTHLNFCSVQAGGRVDCWGSGSQNFGANTGNLLSPTPEPVLASALDWDNNFLHSCIVQDDGRVRCFGSNVHGALGDGTNTDSAEGTFASGITNAVKVVTSAYSTCAVLADGSAKCWGNNNWGQLGNGTTISTNSPVSVIDVGPIVDVSMNSAGAVALLADGTVRLWGTIYNGQYVPNTPSPTEIPGFAGAVQVSLGMNHACAVMGDGSVKCAGDNSYGQLGDGTMTSTATPVTVTGIGPARKVVSNYWHSCALLRDGSAWCWGFPGHATLGNGRFVLSPDHPRPTQVLGIARGTDIVGISGGFNTCVLMNGCSVECWGGEGGMGIGTAAIQSPRVPRPALVATELNSLSIVDSCVVPATLEGVFAARNSANVVVDSPVGQYNKLHGSFDFVDNLGQPTSFGSGITLAHTPIPVDGAVSWTLGTSRARVDVHSRTCAVSFDNGEASVDVGGANFRIGAVQLMGACRVPAEASGSAGDEAVFIYANDSFARIDTTLGVDNQFSDRADRGQPHSFWPGIAGFRVPLGDGGDRWTLGRTALTVDHASPTCRLSKVEGATEVTTDDGTYTVPDRYDGSSGVPLGSQNGNPVVASGSAGRYWTPIDDYSIFACSAAIDGTMTGDAFDELHHRDPSDPSCPMETRFCDDEGNPVPPPTAEELNREPEADEACPAIGGSEVVDASQLHGTCRTKADCPTGEVCASVCDDIPCTARHLSCGPLLPNTQGVPAEPHYCDSRVFRICPDPDATASATPEEASQQLPAGDVPPASATVTEEERPGPSPYLDIDNQNLCTAPKPVPVKDVEADESHTLSLGSKKWGVFIDKFHDEHLKLGMVKIYDPGRNGKELGGWLGAEAGFNAGVAVMGFKLDVLQLRAVAQLGCDSEIGADLRLFGDTVATWDTNTGADYGSLKKTEDRLATPPEEAEGCKDWFRQRNEAMGDLRRGSVAARAVYNHLRKNGGNRDLCEDALRRFGDPDAEERFDCDPDNVSLAQNIDIAKAWKNDYEAKKKKFLDVKLDKKRIDLEKGLTFEGSVTLFEARKRYSYPAPETHVPIVGPLVLTIAFEAYGSWYLTGALDFGMRWDGKVMDALKLATYEYPENVDGAFMAGVGPRLEPGVNLGVIAYVGFGIPGVSAGVEGNLTLLDVSMPGKVQLVVARVAEPDSRDVQQSQFAGEEDPNFPSNVTHRWKAALTYGADIKLTALSGRYDLAARVKLLFFKKTIKHNLASFDGLHFEKHFGGALWGDVDLGLESDPVAYTKLPDLTADQLPSVPNPDTPIFNPDPSCDVPGPG